MFPKNELTTKVFFPPILQYIEKLAKFSNKLEEVVEFNLEEKEKFPIIVFVKRKKKKAYKFLEGKTLT